MAKIAEQPSEHSTKGNSVPGHAPKLAIRPLTEGEIQSLERTLDKPIDRKYLVHWVSLSIRGVVQSSTLPNSRQSRADFTRMAREGRQWIRHLAAYPDIFTPRERSERESLAKAAEAFCKSLDLRAAQAALSTKAGKQKTHHAFEAFLSNMTGVAKKAGLTPSTPRRTRRIRKTRITREPVKVRAKQSRPTFSEFVLQTIVVSRQVINTSPLSDHHKAAALAIIRPASEAALIKAIEKRRGRIRDYEKGTTGLTVWKEIDG
jgi:hypothetical protein